MLARSFILVASLALVAGCSHNPTTGRNQFVGLSQSQEIALGASAAPQMTAEYGGAVKDPQLTSYVDEVGRKLAQHTTPDNHGLPWEFTLLDSKVINAFALPGGKVFVSRGLADKMTNEAQLAGVLGHEIGHVAARHTSEQIGQQQWMNVGLQVASATISRGGGAAAEAGVNVLNIGGQLVQLKFSRKDESEADLLGVRYMTAAGYNPQAQIQVMQILKKESQGGQVELLATHPLPETRIDDLKRELAKPAYASVVNDPRYGFFEAEFARRYHKRAAMLPPPPDSDFALANPATWCEHCRQHQATR